MSKDNRTTTGSTLGNQPTGDQRAEIAAPTPGPWEVRPGGYVIGAVDDPDWIGDIVCDAPTEGESSAFWEANARLISAAPGMIDALRQWAWAERNNDEQELQNARWSRDEAIAKAGGQS